MCKVGGKICYRISLSQLEIWHSNVQSLMGFNLANWQVISVFPKQFMRGQN
jgi:hypothetical protein